MQKALAKFDALPFERRGDTYEFDVLTLLKTPTSLEDGFAHFFSTVRSAYRVIKNYSTYERAKKSVYFFENVLPDALKTITCLSADPRSLNNVLENVRKTKILDFYEEELQKRIEIMVHTCTKFNDKAPGFTVDKLKYIAMRLRLWNNISHSESISRMLPFCADKNFFVHEYVRACEHELDARLRKYNRSPQRQMSARFRMSKRLLMTLYTIEPAFRVQRCGPIFNSVVNMMPDSHLPPNMPFYTCYLCGQPVSYKCQEEERILRLLVTAWIDRRTFSRE